MTDDRIVPIGGKAKRRCPTCGKPSAEEVRPFCSKRCKDLDLHRWFTEGYRVPTEEAPPEAQPQGEEADDEEP